MNIINPNNAFIRLEEEDSTILIDPWLTEGIYDNSWLPMPYDLDKNRLFRDVSIVIITHIHEDHFDLKTLECINREAEILLPDVYPNHVMRNALKSKGFNNITMVPVSTPYTHIRKIEIEFIPRLNSFGQELKDYETNEESLVIDTGVIVNTRSGKYIFMADNVPYRIIDAGESLERMLNPDFLAISYNGLAVDYPLCYKNLIDTHLSIINKRENLRHNSNLEFINTIKPKFIIPYSSEFLVKGPKAIKFIDLLQHDWWGSRNKAALKFSKDTGIDCFALHGMDEIIYKDNHCSLIKKQQNKIDLNAIGESIYSDVTNTKYLYDVVEHKSILKDTVKESVEHMFNIMIRHNINSNSCMEIYLSDNSDELYCQIDFKNKELSYKQNNKHNLILVKLFIDSNYLLAILENKSHWNNAIISLNLDWIREPNIFDRGWFDALNYFHK